MKALFPCIVSILLCVGACAPRHNDYSRFESLPEAGWAYGDSIAFSPVGLDSVAQRSLSVALRHDNDYPYRNLWLEVTYGTPPAMQRDTVSIELADAYGRWHGNGLGPSYQMATDIAPAITLSDSSRISIRHIMRIDTLRGIRQIGIAIGPTSSPL